MITTYSDPNCTTCKGTDHDPLFGGPCWECGPAPTEGPLALLRRAPGPSSVEAPERPAGGGEGTTHTYTSDGPTYRWAKNDHTGKWVVRGPRGAEGTTVVVTKADGSTADVNLGPILGPAKVRGEVLYDLARTPPPARPRATQADAGLDLSGLPSGRYAVPGGDTRLKLEIDNVERGNWAGWVFVKDAAEYGSGERYGKQAPGRTYAGRLVEQLTAILADPRAAAERYGQLTGTCGLCSRPLEDEASVARGIGPVCAKKHGWL